MIDVSYNIPRLPTSGDNLDYQGANAIELNLFALIRAWPAFEDLTVDDKVGTYDYLDTRDNETATPAGGLKVELIQYLPRLIVLLSGDIDKITWVGIGWAEESPGELVYPLDVISPEGVETALRYLRIKATKNADITVILAAENLAWEPGGLRLYGKGKTMILFRGQATWGLVTAKKLTWGGAKPLTWGEASNLRKG